MKVPYAIQITGNASWNGSLPGWASGELVAVTSAEVSGSRNLSVPAGPNSLVASKYPSYVQLTAVAKSLKDITHLVDSDGTLTRSLSATNSSNDIWVFAFYQRRSGASNLIFENNGTNSIFDNGSFVVDHFSVAGADVISAFWESYILDDEIEALLKQVAQYGKPSFATPSWQAYLDHLCASLTCSRMGR